MNTRACQLGQLSLDASYVEVTFAGELGREFTGLEFDDHIAR
jgi:hypothetical protein